jgi:hypothetical protein
MQLLTKQEIFLERIVMKIIETGNVFYGILGPFRVVM